MITAPDILDRADWMQYAAPSIDCSQWSVIIAAAGTGSRLGYGQPKVLFPVAGRSILAWLLDLFLPRCETIVVVLSPEGRPYVKPELARLAAGRFRIAIQELPTGMGDAVEAGLTEVSTPYTAVVWGDQAGILPASTDAVMRVHCGPLAPHLTVPTVLRADPYIHFERDLNRCIIGVRQVREGDAMPQSGESDAGFFCFRTETLRDLLLRLRASADARGARTSETNFLPIVPLAVLSSCRVVTPRIMSVEETVGINNPADASQVAAFLRVRLATNRAIAP